MEMRIFAICTVIDGYVDLLFRIVNRTKKSGCGRLRVKGDHSILALFSPLTVIC
jgi:hypothetical protein